MLENILSTLTPYLTIFGEEPWKQALIVIVAFFIAAWLLDFLINSIIRWVTSGTKNLLDDQIIRHLHRPLIWTLFLAGVVYAAHVFGVTPPVMGILKSVIASIIIMLWAGFALRISKLMLATSIVKADKNSLVRHETLPLFRNVSAILVVIAAVYLIFQAWGVNMTAWLASAGVIGIAVGFAAKDTLANLFSGVFIMADSPYKIGDYVVLDDTSRGKITHIGIRSTRMLTRDDVEITVPNSIMGNSKIINQSGGPHLKFRVRVQLDVAYGSDISKVERVLLEEATKDSLVCKYPAPRVRFRKFGGSGLGYELLFWIDEPELRGRALHQLNSSIYNAFIAEGIEIPFNKQDIYVKELPRR